jgi:hypothetical protein
MAKVKLHNVVLAFPQLFEPRAFSGETNASYSATFILPPDHPDLRALEAAIKEAATQRWGQKGPATLAAIKAKGNLCVRDGANKSDYAGFEGNLYVSSRSKIQPTLLKSNRQPATPQDDLLYAGAVVNAVVDIWAQDNERGKRVNAGLSGVQFARHGERLAGGVRATVDDFDDLGETEVAAGATADADVLW